MKNYKAIAHLLAAIKNCREHNNKEWKKRHHQRLGQIMQTAPGGKQRLGKIMQTAPSGSGFDDGTKLSDESEPERLIFAFSYHHTNKDGYYTHWTRHKFTIKGSMLFGWEGRLTTEKEEYEVAVSGWVGAYKKVKRRPRLPEDFADHVHQVFETWLNEDPDTED